jgi:hypothetical protein
VTSGRSAAEEMCIEEGYVLSGLASGLKGTQ